MKLHYTKHTVIWGAVIYSSGDLVAALILNEFSWMRLIGMMFTHGLNNLIIFAI